MSPWRFRALTKLNADFILSRGNVFVSHLFDPTKDNEHYRYHKGWNVQALIAYIVGVAVPMPGFCASLGASGVAEAGQNLFSIGWLLSFFTSLVVYTGICWIWPAENHKIIEQRALRWEEVGPERQGMVVQEGLPVEDDLEKDLAVVGVVADGGDGGEKK